VLFTRVNHPPRSQVLQNATCGVKTTQQFSELVILLTDMRFKLKERTQRTFFRVILPLNLIVSIDEMGAVEPVGRLTFEINVDEVCVKNCESDDCSTIQNCDWLLTIQNPWFRKSRHAELTNVSLLNSLCQLLNLLGTEAYQTRY